MNRMNLATRARQHFAEERAGTIVDYDRLDALLDDLEKDPTAHGAMREALDVGFRLSGHVPELLNELADSIGYIDEDSELDERAAEYEESDRAAE